MNFTTQDIKVLMQCLETFFERKLRMVKKGKDGEKLICKILNSNIGEKDIIKLVVFPRLLRKVKRPEFMKEFIILADKLRIYFKNEKKEDKDIFNEELTNFIKKLKLSTEDFEDFYL